MLFSNGLCACQAHIYVFRDHPATSQYPLIPFHHLHLPSYLSHFFYLSTPPFPVHFPCACVCVCTSGLFRHQNVCTRFKSMKVWKSTTQQTPKKRLKSRNYWNKWSNRDEECFFSVIFKLTYGTLVFFICACLFQSVLITSEIVTQMVEYGTKSWYSIPITESFSS